MAAFPLFKYFMNMKAPVVIATCALLLTVSACAAPRGDSDSPDLSVLGTWGTPDEPQTPWLQFEDDGTVGGNDGCNSLGGDYSVTDSLITFGDMHMTLMACPGVDDWLNQASTAEISGDSLVLFDSSGNEIGTLPRG